MKLSYPDTNKESLWNNKFVFVFVTYMEKGLGFILPVSVLYFSRSQELYNTIEYWFAASLIVSSFSDFGMRTLFLYASRGSEYSLPSIVLIQRVFVTLTILCIPFLMIGGLVIGRRGLDSALLFTGRTSFLAVYAFFTVVWRFRNRPVLPAVFGAVFMSVSISVVGVFSAAAFVDMIPTALGVLFLLFFFIAILGEGRPVICNAMSELRFVTVKALSVGWPILINSLLSVTIRNFGRVYAFNQLSSEDMFTISILQRITLVVQVAHVALAGYVMKTIFTSNSARIHLMIFLKYIFGIGAVTTLSWISFYIAGVFYPKLPAAGSIETILLFAYVVIWVVGAYFEQYYIRSGRTKTLLINAIGSTVAFLGMIGVFAVRQNMQVKTIAVSMIVSAAVFLFLNVLKGQISGQLVHNI